MAGILETLTVPRTSAFPAASLTLIASSHISQLSLRLKLTVHARLKSWLSKTRFKHRIEDVFVRLTINLVRFDHRSRSLMTIHPNREPIDDVKQDGIRGLYRGFGLSVMTYSPSSAVWWASYGSSQRVRWSLLGHGTDSDGPRPTQGTIVLVQGACGIAAGAVASCITTPLDTIKTRLQSGFVLKICRLTHQRAASIVGCLFI